MAQSTLLKSFAQSVNLITLFIAGLGPQRLTTKYTCTFASD